MASILIAESISDVEGFIKVRDDDIDLQVCSTSPAVIDYCKLNNILLQDIEAFVDLDDFDARLLKISHLLTDFIATAAKIIGGNSEEFKYVFEPHFFSFLCICSYKTFLINKIMLSPTDKLYVANLKNPKIKTVFNVNPDRFDKILSQAAVFDLTAKELEFDNALKVNNRKKIKDIFFEKFVRAIDDNISSLRYFVFNIISKIRGDKDAELKAGYLYIGKHAETISYLFEGLASRFTIRKFPIIEIDSEIDFSFWEHKENREIKRLADQFDKDLRAVVGVERSFLLSDAVRSFSNALLQFSHSRDMLIEKIRGIGNLGHRQSVVLSNYPNSPSERFLLSVLKGKGFVFFGCDHGITQGMSEWARFFSRYHGLLKVNYALAFWEESVADLREFEKHLPVLFVGAPPNILKPSYPRLRRYLARRRLGISNAQHVVMIVMKCDWNNRYVGPFLENDFAQRTYVESVLAWASERYQTSVIVLKKYPSHRYLDEKEWALEHCAGFVETDLPFDVVRFAADSLICFSSQSTLSFVVGVDSCSEYIYLEPSSCPASIVGERFEVDIAGISHGVDIDRNYYLERLESPKGYEATVVKKIQFELEGL